MERASGVLGSGPKIGNHPEAELSWALQVAELGRSTGHDQYDSSLDASLGGGRECQMPNALPKAVKTKSHARLLGGRELPFEK